MTCPASNSPLTSPLANTRRTRHRAGLGFTLIELLVVLAIIATLASLVAPRFIGQDLKAKEAVLRDNLHTTRQVIDQFYGDTGRYPESLDELVERRYLRSLPSDPMTGSTTTWLLDAVPDGYLGTVYDIHSGSPDEATDGSRYADW